MFTGDSESTSTSTSTSKSKEEALEGNGMTPRCLLLDVNRAASTVLAATVGTFILMCIFISILTFILMLRPMRNKRQRRRRYTGGMDLDLDMDIVIVILLYCNVLHCTAL